MEQVAKAAGVTKGTVSRVFNGSPSVRATVVERVRTVAAELGYIKPPQRKAKGEGTVEAWLKSRKVVFVLVAPQGLRWMLRNAPIYAHVLQGAQSALESRGLSLNIATVKNAEEAASLIAGGRTHGVLAIASDLPASIAAALEEVPMVQVMGLLPQGECDHVSYDPERTGALAAGYLSEKGHQLCACLGASNTEVFRRRALAFRRHLENSGVTVEDLLDKDLVSIDQDHNAVEERILTRLVDALIKMKPRPSGLFILADMLAPGVYRLLQAHGIRPGVDLEIVSCNNEEPYLNDLRPVPAVVDVQGEEIGFRAVEQLFWRMQNPSKTPVSITIAPRLVLPPQ